MEDDDHDGDSVTKAVVNDALEELKQKKKSKQKQHQQKVETGEDLEARKGKTFSQIEREETGGTVREAEVGMAHAKRAVKRKGKGADLEDTELATNVEDAEEDIQLEAEEDANKDEVELTGFNLNEERETGYFDADGHYVERKNEDEDATDAWLESTEANMASAAARANHEAQLRAMEAREAGDSAPLSESAIAALKGRAAKLMLDGENVTKALKRLGGGSKKPVLKSKNKKKHPMDDSTQGGSSTADKVAFSELAELVDQLLSAGEMDIYTESKFQMQREADLYSGPTILDKGGDNSGDDMFAEDSDDDERPAKRPAVEAAATPAPEASPAASTAPETAAGVAAGSVPQDLSALPVKELQKFLRDRGVDITGIVEKEELVSRAQSVSLVPEGYVYHAESGYYWGAQDGMYCDSTSGGFYSPVTQEWSQRNPATGEFTPWQATQ